MFTIDYSNTGSGNSQTAAPSRIALDFSSLDNIKRAKRAENTPEAPVKEDFAPLPLPTRPKAENAPERRTGEKRAHKSNGKSAKSRKTSKTTTEKAKIEAAEEQAAAFLEAPELPKVDPEKEYLKARLQCSQQQAAILKQLRAGESIYSLFLQAMKALSLLMGEEITYTVAEKELKAVYGYALEAPDVLQTLLSEAGERLKKLEAAEQAEKDKTTDEYKRICGAIAAHKQRIAELEAKAKNAAGT